MATRRLLTTPFLGRGRVPSSFRYSNHLRSFQIPHSTLAASSGSSAPSNHERTVSIQIVLRSSLPERDADSLLNSGEPTRWMNVLMQSSANRLPSISTYYEKSSPDRPCAVKPNAHLSRSSHHRKGHYHYESPAAPNRKRLLKRISSKIADYLLHQLLPWFWATSLKVLEGIVVQYLSNNLAGPVWNKLWRALEEWLKLLPGVWATSLKVLGDMVVQYLSNVAGPVWSKLWLALKKWLGW